MGFWKKLFKKKEDQQSNSELSTKGAKISINEDLIVCIILSIGSPSLPLSSGEAARLYKQLNPNWSGRHQIYVTNISSELKPGATDQDALAKVIMHAIDLDIVTKVAEGGIAAYIQDCDLYPVKSPTRIPSAFCTFVPSNEKKIIPLGGQTPINMYSKTFCPKDPSMFSGLPFNKLKHIFLFTDGDGDKLYRSQEVVSSIEDFTGQPLSTINVRVPSSLVYHSQVCNLIDKSDQFPDIGFAEIEKCDKGKQCITEGLNTGALTLQFRQVKDSKSGQKVAIVAIYSA